MGKTQYRGIIKHRRLWEAVPVSRFVVKYAYLFRHFKLISDFCPRKRKTFFLNEEFKADIAWSILTTDYCGLYNRVSINIYVEPSIVRYESWKPIPFRLTSLAKPCKRYFVNDTYFNLFQELFSLKKQARHQEWARQPYDLHENLTNDYIFKALSFMKTDLP
ncbi:hypothetical protein M514_27645 [Trichuris suis]|uniref:Uncharacterized protein n=1 Tax=Trichuris suis TaxID=68888 RepID=A0A085MSI1_9BILA|nr:hypothetical protein M514_27645 [Trichuris suis]